MVADLGLIKAVPTSLCLFSVTESTQSSARVLHREPPVCAAFAELWPAHPFGVSSGLRLICEPDLALAQQQTLDKSQFPAVLEPGGFEPDFGNFGV